MGVSGDFSRLDRNQAKRHHFVPHFLLRGFALEHNGNDRLFQMETASRGARRRVDLGTAASRRRLYTAIDEDGEPSNRNEGYLALVESHAAPVLRQLMDNPESLSPAERATISFFVALQTMRTPAAAQQGRAVHALMAVRASVHDAKPVAGDALREALRGVATPVTVLTAIDSGRPHGRPSARSRRCPCDRRWWSSRWPASLACTT
jgi:hypothetical protein